ncbi:Crp/Fnr family transcriptional regulator [Hydrogenophaga sp. SL48]|uniref:Crp/Fnr family transcriptional regulator n=1 Tax=Hydrogenophaga sp. SL48 TaxID=2806347 RepID=UPI001F44F5AE|nr:Crp/Fnr family transcriptional regulator [Hydrogenophaga sp. SL48]UJW82261.1 Crp/Fnr family transcriptional regulator [Hydrogenophaga sp. SL48]
MTRTPAPSTAPAARCQVCAARLNCLIGGLPRARQVRLDPWISEVDFRKGDTLQVEGAATEVVRTIKLGTVMLTRRGLDGVARPVAIMGRGHLLGQWRLLDQPTQVGALALSSGRACELPVASLGGTLLQDPVFLNMLHTGMAHTFARLADWSQVVRLRGLPRQLVATLVLLGEAQGASAVRLPSHVALAAVLNTTRESVARTLRQLETGGHLRRIDRWHAELSRSHREVFENDLTPP